MELDWRGHKAGTTLEEDQALTTAHIVRAFRCIFLTTEDLESYRYRCPIFPVPEKGSQAV